MLLAREQAAMREELATAFDARGVLFEVGPLGEGVGASDAACGTAAQPAFIEVAGPHARAHAYADAIDKLVKSHKESKADKATATPADPVRVLVVSARHPSCSVSSPLVWRLVISPPRQLSSRRFPNPLRAGNLRRLPV